MGIPEYNHSMSVDRSDFVIPTKVTFLPQERKILSEAKMLAHGYALNYHPPYGGHGQSHWDGVTGLSGIISVLEKQDPFLPVLSGILHDIGRTKTDDPRAKTSLHSHVSAEMAEDFLQECFTGSVKDLVYNAIHEHSAWNTQLKDPSFVLKTLIDADRLDRIGFSSPIVAAVFDWDMPIIGDTTSKMPLDQQKGNLYHIFAFRYREWYENLYTESAKKIGKPWHEDLQFFCAGLAKEMTQRQIMTQAIEI